MKRYVTLFLLALLAGETAFAQMENQQPVAQIDLNSREDILVGQLKQEIQRQIWVRIAAQTGRNPVNADVLQAAKGITVEDRRQILNDMINEKLILQAAARDLTTIPAAQRQQLTVTDAEINERIAQLKAQMEQRIARPPTEPEFNQAIKVQTGYEPPAFRDSLRRGLLVQKYLVFKKKDKLENIPVPTEAEILNVYNLSKAQFFVRPDTIRFSMIQVPYGADAAAKTRSKELADRLSREISGDPSKFDETVIKSQAPNSGYQAGEGGYLPRNPQAQQAAGMDFINTAFSLKQGEVSKVIEGLRAYQIIKVTETYPMKTLELDDIFQLGTRFTVRQAIDMDLRQQMEQRALMEAHQELTTELKRGNTTRILEATLTGFTW